MKCYDQHLPRVSLLCKALGEASSYSSKIYVLTERAHDALLDQVAACKRDELVEHLMYIRNMSCIGCDNPDMNTFRNWFQLNYGVDIGLKRYSTDT